MIAKVIFFIGAATLSVVVGLNISTLFSKTNEPVIHAVGFVLCFITGVFIGEVYTEVVLKPRRKTTQVNGNSYLP